MQLHQTTLEETWLGTAGILRSDVVQQHLEVAASPALHVPCLGQAADRVRPPNVPGTSGLFVKVEAFLRST